MSEARAVQISYELWLDWITQGYERDGVRCVKGVPEGARLIGLFPVNYRAVVEGAIPVDLVMVVEGENWSTAAEEYTIDTPWDETCPVMMIKFEVRSDQCASSS